MVQNRSTNGKNYLYLLPFECSYIQDKAKAMKKLFTKPDGKQVTDYLRTVTAASEFINCTLVQCAITPFYPK